jgi:hypothetical protein
MVGRWVEFFSPILFSPKIMTPFSPPSAIPLVVVALAVIVPPAAPSSSYDVHLRNLQGSVPCFASGTGNFATCCPDANATGPNPDDGLCSLLSCLEIDDLSLRDECDCGDVMVACNQVAIFAAFVDQIPEICTSVASCCTGSTGGVDGGGTARNVSTTLPVENAAWNDCMAHAEEVGNYTIPDFSVLIPGESSAIDLGPQLNVDVGAGAAMTASTEPPAAETTAVGPSEKETSQEVETSATADATVEPIPEAETTSTATGCASGWFAAVALVFTFSSMGVPGMLV